MKQKTLFFLFVLSYLSAAGHAAAETVRPRDKSPSLMDESFVVETSEEDIDDSLNRISGNIDRGFAADEYTYKSEHQGRSGPFSHNDTYDPSTSY